MQLSQDFDDKSIKQRDKLKRKINIKIKIEDLITTKHKMEAKSLSFEIKSKFREHMLKGETVRYAANEAGISSMIVAFALALQQNTHLDFAKS